jgi:hypothetical protein
VPVPFDKEGRGRSDVAGSAGGRVDRALSREASSAEVAKDGQYNDDDDEDPKPRWHERPFVGSTAILRPADSSFNDVPGTPTADVCRG